MPKQKRKGHKTKNQKTEKMSTRIVQKLSSIKAAEGSLEDLKEFLQSFFGDQILCLLSFSLKCIKHLEGQKCPIVYLLAHFAKSENWKHDISFVEFLEKNLLAINPPHEIRSLLNLFGTVRRAALNSKVVKVADAFDTVEASLNKFAQSFIAGRRLTFSVQKFVKWASLKPEWPMVAASLFVVAEQSQQSFNIIDYGNLWASYAHDYFNRFSEDPIIAAKRRAGLGDERKSCSTVMAGFKSLASTPGRRQMALADS